MRRTQFILGISFQIALLFIIPRFCSISAQESTFKSEYQVEYNVDEQGETQVTQKLTFENTTQDYYVPGYRLDFSHAPEKIHVFDNTGDLPFELIQEDKLRNVLEVDFSSRLVGPKERYVWTLTYKAPSITKRRGRLWEVQLPKLNVTADTARYDVKLRVPEAFGALSIYNPAPSQSNRTNGAYELSYQKEDVGDGGIYLVFGESQAFRFTLKYHLENPNTFTGRTPIALIPDTNLQTVYYEELTPKPDDIVVDGDGNYLAYYLIPPNGTVEVVLTGWATVSFPSSVGANAVKLNEIPATLKQYTLPSTFWQVDDVVISSQAESLISDDESVLKTARNIFDFVSSTLIYDAEAFSKNRKRLGAVEALAHKENSVCIEFTDLFIALMRSAGIPAREIDGYAVLDEDQLKPTLSDVLHAWAEFYLPNYGWIQVDPTWQATSNGRDFFSSFDMNRLTFVVKGIDSETPYPAGSYKLSPDQQNDVVVDYLEDLPIISTQNQLNLSLESPRLIAGGFTHHLKLMVENNGPTTLYNVKPSVDSIFNLQLPEKSIIDVLPPFARVTIPVDLHVSNFLMHQDEAISLSAQALNKGGEAIVGSQEAVLKIRTFLTVYLFPILGGLIAAIILFALLFIVLHSSRRHEPK